jgi:hypothetical protein
MNITLIYNDSKFNVDILSDTTCQYLYNIANKIFQIPLSQFKLIYKEYEIENNSRLIFSVLSQIDPDNYNEAHIIRVELLPNTSTKSQNKVSVELPTLNNQSDSSKVNLRPSFNKKKYSDMLCQICNHKNSIYYCRVCNLFVCFECNVRYNEHKNHDKINLEDGDAFLGCEVYREEIIKDINIIELGFKQTQKWMIDNTDREGFLQGLFKSLEYIRSHSLNLADMKTMYSLDEEMINDFKIEIDKIQIPRHREEIVDSFGSLNLKENELRNYTKFLNLQIIKTEYNKVLLKCLDKVKQNMDKLGEEVKARLAECEEIKFRNINDIKLYLKEYGFKKKQNDIDNFLAKNYVPKEKNDKLNNEDNNEEEADDDDNNENEKNDMSDEKNNIIILNPVSGTNKKSNLKKNLLTISGAKFDKNRNLTLDKRLKGLKLKHDKVKNKFKLKELINNFTVSSLPKKKELLVPLKIKKSINLKKNETVNELSNIAKPKNLKKFLFNTKQELSEADFQDFPLNLKKKEKDIEKITKSPNRKNESDDNDLDNKLNAKNPINLKNIDFSGFIGQEKKISFMSPSRGRNNLYRKSIVKKTKTIFDNI